MHNFRSRLCVMVHQELVYATLKYLLLGPSRTFIDFVMDGREYIIECVIWTWGLQ